MSILLSVDIIRANGNLSVVTKESILLTFQTSSEQVFHYFLFFSSKKFNLAYNPVLIH